MEEELKYILIDNFKTNKGDKIDQFRITYQIFGQTLGNSPVILVNHALTGNSLLTGKNGWWKEIVGQKKTIDTSKYTVLCFNIPGNGFNDNNFDYSLKVTVTNPDTSIPATGRYLVRTKLEGNSIYDLNFGSSAAKNITLSF